jgi:hypothetical protein
MKGYSIWHWDKSSVKSFLTSRTHIPFALALLNLLRIHLDCSLQEVRKVLLVPFHMMEESQNSKKFADQAERIADSLERIGDHIRSRNLREYDFPGHVHSFVRSMIERHQGDVPHYFFIYNPGTE